MVGSQQILTYRCPQISYMLPAAAEKGGEEEGGIKSSRWKASGYHHGTSNWKVGGRELMGLSPSPALSSRTSLSLLYARSFHLKEGICLEKESLKIAVLTQPAAPQVCPQQPCRHSSRKGASFFGTDTWKVCAYTQPESGSSCLLGINTSFPPHLQGHRINLTPSIHAATHPLLQNISLNGMQAFSGLCPFAPAMFSPPWGLSVTTSMKSP